MTREKKKRNEKDKMRGNFSLFFPLLLRHSAAAYGMSPVCRIVGWASVVAFVWICEGNRHIKSGIKYDAPRKKSGRQH